MVEQGTLIFSEYNKNKLKNQQGEARRLLLHRLIPIK